MAFLEHQVSDALKNTPGLAAIYLFGSQASGRAGPQSDVDVAILFERGYVPDSLALFELKNLLETMLRTDVDLVCLNGVSPIVAMQVLRHGKELLVLNSETKAQWMMTACTDYADLKIVRKQLEKSILDRRIYGGS